MIQDLEGRRVSLIGGAGFIGHHLALALRDRGCEVQVVDGLEVNNLVTYTANVERLDNRFLYVHFLNERLRLLEDAGVVVNVQDARDYHALSQLLGSFEPQVIVQLAAIAHAGHANKNPYTTFDHSMRTLENALDYARNGVEHFVFFSSSMVYGNFPSGHVTEETPCEPLGIYGALKLGGEKLVVAYNQVFDLPYTIVRPSALYGERCVSRRVVQLFIENALRGKPIRVTGAGESRLDFTYVRDLVSGIVNVVENDASRNETFNLTYGESRSIAEVADLVLERYPGAGIERVAADRLMPERGTLSVEKAAELVGYDPVFPIDVGVRRYLDFYEKERANHPDLLSGG